MRNVSDKRCKKIKAHILFLVSFSRKPCTLCGDMEKYAKARKATDENISRMSIACWTAKSIDTHSEYVILVAS
jgi:thioredoxin-related protein